MRTLIWIGIIVYSLVPGVIAYFLGGEKATVGNLYLIAIGIALIVGLVKWRVNKNKEEF